MTALVGWVDLFERLRTFAAVLIVGGIAMGFGVAKANTDARLSSMARQIRRRNQR